MGMRFVGKVGTPDLFQAIQGWGEWEFGQLIDIFRYVELFGQPPPLPYASYAYWLDNSWPYGTGIMTPAHYDAIFDVATQQGTTGMTSDSPTHGIEGFSFYNCFDRFKMYQMFKPPSNGNDSSPGAGDASAYVPLNRFEWNWNATDTRSASTDPYDPTPGTVTSGNSEPNPLFPFWDHKYTNDMTLP